jgi:hypothetical protein
MAFRSRRLSSTVRPYLRRRQAPFALSLRSHDPTAGCEEDLDGQQARDPEEQGRHLLHPPRRRGSVQGARQKGKSLAADRRKKAKTVAKKGQGDKGDQKVARPKAKKRTAAKKKSTSPNRRGTIHRSSEPLRSANGDSSNYSDAARMRLYRPCSLPRVAQLLAAAFDEREAAREGGFKSRRGGGSRESRTPLPSLLCRQLTRLRRPLAPHRWKRIGPRWVRESGERECRLSSGDAPASGRPRGSRTALVEKLPFSIASSSVDSLRKRRRRSPVSAIRRTRYEVQ